MIALASYAIIARYIFRACGPGGETLAFVDDKTPSTKAQKRAYLSLSIYDYIYILYTYVYIVVLIAHLSTLNMFSVAIICLYICFVDDKTNAKVYKGDV